MRFVLPAPNTSECSAAVDEPIVATAIRPNNDIGFGPRLVVFPDWHQFRELSRVKVLANDLVRIGPQKGLVLQYVLDAPYFRSITDEEVAVRGWGSR